MVYDIVLGTVSEFIMWAQTIVAIFIIYYLFRFIFFGSGEDDGGVDAEGARKKIKEFMTKQKDESDKKKKLEGRQKILNKCLGYLHRALNATRDMQDRFHDNGSDEDEIHEQIKKALSDIKELKENLSHARYHARGAHRYHEDEMTESLHEIHAAIDAVFEKASELAEIMPEKESRGVNYQGRGQKFREGATELARYISALYSTIRKYVEAHDNEKIKIDKTIKELERVSSEATGELNEARATTRREASAEEQNSGDEHRSSRNQSSRRQRPNSRRDVRLRPGRRPR